MTETFPQTAPSISVNELFRALGDDTRVRILLLLRQRSPLCVCELMWLLEQSQPLVSRHLKFLRAMHLVTTTRRGQWVYYQLSDWPVWMQQVIEAVETSQQVTLNRLPSQLTCMPNRPC